jgi:hypothetical protein
VSVLEVLAPRGGPAGVEEIVGWATSAPRREPYCEETLSRVAALSRRLSQQAGRAGDLQALAFFMRRSELERLRGEYLRLSAGPVRLVPRGVVMHFPPANVETMFVYSWLLSELAGNINVVRLSERRGPLSELILAAVAEASGSTMVVSYPHEDEDVTFTLSQASDVRVVWGGDQTVAAVRRVPLRPDATELCFADRSSLAVLDAERYLALDGTARAGLAERFFADAYWFDQLGCSSPRVVVWVGEPGASARAGQAFFSELLSVVAGRGYRVDTATALAKLTYAARAAADHPGATVERPANELTVVDAGGFVDVGPDFCGAGTFWQARVGRLEELAGVLGRRHQTLAHFGFDRSELAGLVGALAGRGVDRVVPVGEALSFGRWWDGHDLLQAFLRCVHMRV